MNDKSYSNWHLKSDTALGETIGAYVQHHRLKQNLSQEEVSEAAGISRSTLSLLERGGAVKLMTLIQVLRVLDLLSVMEVFEIKEEESPLAYAKLKKKQKKRASGKGHVDSDVDLGW
jgi:transcriptional regulator with XRE-family HTH domain